MHTAMFDDEEILNEACLEAECRAIKKMTKRQLVEKATFVRLQVDDLMGDIGDQDSEEGRAVVTTEADYLEFLMTISNAVDERAKLLGLALAPWKTRETTAPILKWWNGLKDVKGNNVLTFPGKA